MCCTKISSLDYFSKSRNRNLHVLVHKVLLKFRCEYEIKQTSSSRHIYWKTVAWSLPFRKTPLFAVATSTDWWRTASSRRFGVYKLVSRPKLIPVAPVYNFWRETSFVNSEAGFELVTHVSWSQTSKSGQAKKKTNKKTSIPNDKKRTFDLIRWTFFFFWSANLAFSFFFCLQSFFFCLHFFEMFFFFFLGGGGPQFFFFSYETTLMTRARPPPWWTEMSW